MSLEIYEGRYVGWDIDGRLFTPEEYKKSHLAKEGGTYEQYVKAAEYLKTKNLKGAIKKIEKGISFW